MTMKLNKETRRHWNFTVQDGLHFGADGIEVKDGIASFPRDVTENKGKGWQVFKSPDECIEWFEQNMPIKAAGGRTKELWNVITSKMAATNEDFNQIKKFMVNPDRFNPEDILVYRSFLANNFRDRSGERIPLPVLKTLSESIVGKAKLFGHEHSGPGFGRYFKSEVVSMTPDECLAMMQEKVSKKQEQFIRMASEIDGAVNWMVPSFYLLAEDQEIAKRIDAGIIFHESISFRCRTLIEYKDPKDQGKVLWLEYVNTDEDEAEACEGSYVWLGAQHGAGTRKAFELDNDEVSFDDAVKPFPNNHACRLEEPGQFSKFITTKRKHNKKEYSVIIGYRPDGSSDDQAFRYSVETWTADEAQKHCTDHGGNFEAAKPKNAEPSKEVKPAAKPGGRMKIKFLSLEKEYELNEEGVNLLVKEATDEAEKIETRVKDAENAISEIKKVIGDDVSAETLKSVKKNAEIGKELFDELVKAAVALSVQSGFTENTPEKVSAQTEFFKGLTVDAIKTQMVNFQKVVDEKFPPTERQLKEQDAKDPLDLDKDYAANY